MTEGEMIAKIGEAAVERMRIRRQGCCRSVSPDDAVAASGVKGERYKAARAQPNPAPSRFKGANTGWCPMIEPA